MSPVLTSWSSLGPCNALSSCILHSYRSPVWQTSRITPLNFHLHTHAENPELYSHAASNSKLILMTHLKPPQYFSLALDNVTANTSPLMRLRVKRGILLLFFLLDVNKTKANNIFLHTGAARTQENNTSVSLKRSKFAYSMQSAMVMTNQRLLLPPLHLLRCEALFAVDGSHSSCLLVGGEVRVCVCGGGQGRGGCASYSRWGRR